ncbi:MAG: hypothetical protein KAI29_14895 [Cyclobacteriaceae bacterium]|nr:hypothetical protein [Cyclobacteriaceae bacterium]
MFKALAESLQLIRICNPNEEHSSSGSFRIVNPKERSSDRAPKSFPVKGSAILIQKLLKLDFSESYIE